MNAILSKLLRREMYDRIPSDDLMSRQRFALFRIFTYTSFIVCMTIAIQVSTTFEKTSILSFVMVVLSIVVLLNFFLVNKIEKLPLSYAIILFAGFLVVHMQAYNTGGVLNTGTIYMCVEIMAAFMLLGSRAGKWFTFMVLGSIIFLYFVTEYTSLTSYELLKNDPHLINQDALTTFIFALFLVAAQSNYLNSGKNVIIERITEQKNQLEISNRRLQAYTASLEKTNKELDKFASIVSHDLKAPLRAIGNLTGWIEEDAGDTMKDEVKANFELIKQRVKRMEDLINAILDYSKADRVQGDESSFDVKRLVEDTVDFIGKPDNLKLIVSNNLPVMVSDKVRLSQVFSNLIEMDKLVNILLVDDDEVDCMNVQRAFKKSNILNPLYIAHNGIEALDLLRGTNNAKKIDPIPRIILLDINMPKMNGLEFLKEMRADKELHSISVFVMTTSNDDRDRFEAYNHNVAGYIIKPISFENFVAAVSILNNFWQLCEQP